MGCTPPPRDVFTMPDADFERWVQREKDKLLLVKLVGVFGGFALAVVFVAALALAGALG